MRREVMLKEVIFVVKLSLIPVWFWPLSQDATQFMMICMKLYHCFSIVIAMTQVAPLTYAITNHLDNPMILVHLVLIISSLIHSSFNFFFYMVNHHRIQNVTFEMVRFSGLMKPHEKVVIQRYVDKCVVFHGGSIPFFYFFPSSSIVVPLLTQQSFPTLAEYPFDVSYQPLKTILYLHQSMTGIQVGGQLCANIFMALLIWFASARFEILSEELEKVTSTYQLHKYIKKHQKLIEYATEVALVARPFAFTAICCSTVTMIGTFLVFITNQPIPVKLQYLGLSLACISEVFMYTWSAEHLMFMCHDVGQTAFNMLKNNNLINLFEIWKCLQIIIMRSQEPIKISIPCLLPTLSLKYFTSYLSTIFSYFTTLRVVMDTDNN